MKSGKHPRVVAIIQARMGSTRLPGKVLAEIHGRPMLWRVVERARRAESLDETIVATTTQPADDAIVALCREQGVGCFRGSEADVLDRYHRAAAQYRAEVVVRITSDCPLIDPCIVDQVVHSFVKGGFDYASNGLVRSYPRGLDVEVMTFAALQRAHAGARQAYQRAHVTPYLYENPQQFRLLSVTADRDYSAYRWTVDTPEDMALVRAVYDHLAGEVGSFDQVVRLMEREPELAEMNGSVPQKALQEG
jgi:spore coat polysaccharide biosynthesis protein SpsF